MVRADLQAEFIAANGLVEQFEQIEDSYVGDDDKITDRMRPDLKRLLGYLETLSSLEDPDEDEQRMRILLTGVERLPIYRWINAKERLRIFSSALDDSEKFGFHWGRIGITKLHSSSSSIRSAIPSSSFTHIDLTAACESATMK